MKISEVEKELHITRANIRFYEKEGLFSPSRADNGYREYTSEDVAIHKKIVVYRKLGISVNDIQRIFNQELDLQDAVCDSIVHLQNEIEKLNGSIELCRKIQNNNVTDSEFNESYYWEEINKSESSGNKFIDICKDYAAFEKNLFFDAMKAYFWGFDFQKIEKRHGLLKLAALFILICVCRGITGVLIWKKDSFFDGFLTPFILFLIVSIILLPTFLFKNKYPKFVKIWNIIVFSISIVFLLLVIGVLIFLLIRMIFDF